LESPKVILKEEKDRGECISGSKELIAINKKGIASLISVVYTGIEVGETSSPPEQMPEHVPIIPPPHDYEKPLIGRKNTCMIALRIFFFLMAVGFLTFFQRLALRECYHLRSGW
jgi:hypothetical protein